MRTGGGEGEEKEWRRGGGVGEAEGVGGRWAPCERGQVAGERDERVADEVKASACCQGGPTDTRRLASASRRTAVCATSVFVAA